MIMHLHRFLLVLHGKYSRFCQYLLDPCECSLSWTSLHDVDFCSLNGLVRSVRFGENFPAGYHSHEAAQFCWRLHLSDCCCFLRVCSNPLMVHQMTKKLQLLFPKLTLAGVRSYFSCIDLLKNSSHRVLSGLCQTP